ncbi:uncharacterized protein LOC123320419 [Coccinella septempunctata]|uniref:uncharacterized protein LOC123320419 n=1 Tax=Coccinella septempunctata TaxID=41139 RepID=UPI001D06CB1F|nr:uncharacterized protein LOC123320419 [Coccinella septempunctata]
MFKIVSLFLTILLFACNVFGQTETTLHDLLIPTLPPVTSAQSPTPQHETTVVVHETEHPTTTTEAANKLPTNLKNIKEILELILPLDDVHLEVVKEFLPVSVELAKLAVHFM